MVLNEFNAWFDTTMLVFIRISAMLASAPVIGKPYVPPRIQILLALGVTALVLPSITITLAVPLFSVTGMVVALQQLLIGLSMGFVLKIIFEIFTLAGQFLAMQSGLGYAMVVDPQRGTQVAVIGQLFMITASMVFIMTNGHLMLIKMIVDSFNHLPVGEMQFSATQFMNIANFGREMFAGGVNIALPAVTALLLLNFSMAMMNRAAPQLHLFTIGFPLMLLVGLFAIYLTYGITFNHVDDKFELGYQFIHIWLSGR